MYGCEAWTLTGGSLHKLNTVWDNCFLWIFSCCWRESTRPLQFHRKSLPVYLLRDQRKLILWVKMHRSNNIVLKILSGVNYYELLATCSKYSIDVSDTSENIISQTIWIMYSYTVHANLWAFIFTFVWYFVFLSLSLCTFVLHVTVLLPLGAIKDDEYIETSTSDLETKAKLWCQVWRPRPKGASVTVHYFRTVPFYPLTIVSATCVPLCPPVVLVASCPRRRRALRLTSPSYSGFRLPGAEPARHHCFVNWEVFVVYTVKR